MSTVGPIMFRVWLIISGQDSAHLYSGLFPTCSDVAAEVFKPAFKQADAAGVGRLLRPCHQRNRRGSAWGPDLYGLFESQPNVVLAKAGRDGELARARPGSWVRPERVCLVAGG